MLEDIVLNCTVRKIREVDLDWNDRNKIDFLI
jgi:hypothetical protein